MSNTQKVALVTGASKGIGFEIARQLGRQGVHVVVGAREESKAQAAAKKLEAEGFKASGVKLDVVQSSDVAGVVKYLEKNFGKLDILVNNAGVLLDLGIPAATVSEDMLRKTFDSNFFGPFFVTQALLPLLQKSEAGRVVNMSSTWGSLTLSGDKTSPLYQMRAPVYQSSKAALNALTVMFGRELEGTKVKVNAACPGWVKTDMGGPTAPLTVEQGADTPVWLATLPADGPTGKFFNSRQPMPW